jgi:hypothetical protein
LKIGISERVGVDEGIAVDDEPAIDETFERMSNDVLFRSQEPGYSIQRLGCSVLDGGDDLFFAIGDHGRIKANVEE